MHTHRVHTVRSKDGTEIAGRVYGAGPPVIFLPAGPGESEMTWQHVLPFAAEQFTCYMMNTRGRGLSENAPDHAPQRLVEDITAFANSIGMPVGLVEAGTSLWTLVAAEHGDAVGGVVAYEPGLDNLMSEEIATTLGDAFVRMDALAAQDRLQDAARVFIEASHVIYGTEEMAAGVPAGFWLAAAPDIPVFLQDEEQIAESEGPRPAEDSVLDRVRVPVLLLRGTRTNPWFVESMRHVAEHVAGARVREIAGAAHFGIYTHAQAVAEELGRFLSRILAAD